MDSASGDESLRRRYICGLRRPPHNHNVHAIRCPAGIRQGTPGSKYGGLGSAQFLAGRRGQAGLRYGAVFGTEQRPLLVFRWRIFQTRQHAGAQRNQSAEHRFATRPPTSTNIAKSPASGGTGRSASSTPARVVPVASRPSAPRRIHAPLASARRSLIFFWKWSPSLGYRVPF